MTAAVRPTIRVLIYEHACSTPPDGEWHFELFSRLLDRGFAVKRVAVVDELSAADSARTIVLGPMIGGQPPRELATANAMAVLDTAGLSPEAAVERVEAAAAAVFGAPMHWKPWFPAIDYQRCTNCMQCLSFCLFDVYGVSAAGRLTVQNPAHCKTDCPACSRVCPEVAIVFPKYKAGPINGEEIRGDDVRREAMKIDISSLLGGDVYSVLRDRSLRAKSRFSAERDDDRALKERQRCLAQLQAEISALDIPPQVLASLPSPDEIQQKAAAARRRAEEALRQAASTDPN
jgi:NAD-dependent dihydropyrimidine dehydrogenase PreA subunit